MAIRETPRSANATKKLSVVFFQVTIGLAVTTPVGPLNAKVATAVYGGNSLSVTAHKADRISCHNTHNVIIESRSLR